MGGNKSLTTLSLGAGVQSSTLALMLDRGVLDAPKPDFAIFADTQWEPRAVYEHLAWLEAHLSFPVMRVTVGSIREAVLANALHKDGFRYQATVVPAFTSRRGMIARQCTGEYKIEPIIAEIRRRLGVEPGKRVPKDTCVLQMMGISADEAIRMKDNRHFYIKNKYPLVDAGLTRSDCIAWFSAHYPGHTLPRSACIGCPYHSDDEWRHIRDTAPDEFEDACVVDDALRAGEPRLKPDERSDGHLYLHSSGVPLREARFDKRSRTNQTLGLFSHELMMNECEGMCGV